MGKNVSLSVVRRLPRYYRFLSDLLSQGTIRISSKELSQRMGLTASQIRQDLNCFGGFGQQGYGYNVEQLYREIGSILGVNKTKNAILIGVGNLGRAIATHMNFEERGFNLTGIFDRNPAIVGQIIRGVTVKSPEQIPLFCKKNSVEVAFLCIPKEGAQEITRILIDCGVRGFWNFSHYDLTVEHKNIAVENVHLSDSLMTLCYQVSHLDDED